MGMLTIEGSIVFTVPYNEAGAKQLKQDGRLQAEINFENGIKELFHSDGVEVITVACDIVSPEDIF